MDIITINKSRGKKYKKIISDEDFNIPNFNEYEIFYNNSLQDFYSPNILARWRLSKSYSKC